MRRILASLSILIMILFCQFSGQAQTTGAIGGTITDSNGAVLPNATITVKGEGGQQFTATTAENGTFKIPAVAAGLYTVTVTSQGFKKSVINNVKVDIGVPATVDTALEIGSIEQVVEVTTGAEVLQTQTATIGRTITGRQITETPIASRDALDLVNLLPGTATVGRPRTSSINGLPKGSLSITIDGVDVQVNDSRSSDGFFTYVRPRVDAIEEVTVSTANPGAESSGDGAIQIKMVTKRGANDYHIGAFWQHRNDAFNANYWYLNRNPAGFDKNGKSLRQKMRLNQYGFSGSGPIPFLKFGEGGGMLDSGKDKRFFFFNYEEFRQPQSLSRTRKIISPEAQAGTYQYFATIPGSGLPTGCATTATANQMLCSRNVLTIAQNVGQLATVDPTVASIYSRIRTAISGQTLVPIANNPNVFDWNTLATNGELRKFLAIRFDANITKNHSFEAVINRQNFGGQKDLLNGREETFPGFPSFNQVSDRNSYTFAVRSTFGQSIVNEARYAVQEGGPTVFAGDSSPSVFDFMGGKSLGIFPTLTGTAVTAPVLVNGTTRSKNPVFDFTDSVTWIMGSHSLNFGGNYKIIRSEANNNNRYVPSVGFGLDSTDTAAFNMFSTTAMPGASTAQLTDARNLYSVLVGRVLSYTTTAYLNTETGIYAENGASIRKAEQKSYGAFIQDSWRITSNFTVNYGVRWQPQTGFIAKSNGNYTRLENYAQVYGLSGLNNIFKPGTLTGTAPRVVKVEVGEKVYPDDLNNFAPTIGVVWSPNFGDKGILRAIFGGSGQSVFRGGYSVAFVREGTALLESINGANPGGNQVLNRGLTIPGSFTVGTNLRDANNPNLRAFESTGAGTIIGQAPAFPIALTISNSTNAFNPDIKTGQVRSYSFGYQREIDRNTVVEVRYVGNEGTGLQRQYNLNEFNTIENNFAAEFKLAQDNLYANIAAGRCITAGQTPTTNPGCQFNFAYFGTGTGTAPLPIMMSYFNAVAANLPNNPAGVAGTPYTAANFANTTLVAALSRLAPSIATFNGANFENNATRRANAIANGRPSNFFYVNPTSGPSGSWTVDNTNETWYHSGVLEVRRRLSNGLRLSANYVFSKAMANAFTADAGGGGGQPPTNRRPIGLDLARNVQISDLRHQFKVDATYELPFGKGGQFFSGANGIVNGFIGGWTLAPTLRWQSGSPITIGNVQLVGMTAKDLQKAIKVRKEANLVFFLPDDIILNSKKAFNIDVTNTANNGYGTTFGSGGPTGRYLAPAGTGNCISTFGGQCGFTNLVVYGPTFFKLDASLSKKVKFGERLNIEFRATALDVLNHPNFRVGGFGADTAGFGCCGTTFGELANGSAYQDTSTTNDPGGRVIDLMFRINW